ncbi:MAG: hypothetical protein DRJ05_15300 [Bacteroidetes bacterium]|nr:MAG: hypothetical protein DRJ05_15300 [Bacteroidota bacterium]
MIENYFSNIEGLLNNCEFIERYEISKQKINNSFGTISGKVFFQSGVLSFLEVVRISEQIGAIMKKHKYHFMKNNNSIVFRYDNMPHHPDIITFPHHKHIDGNIIESHEPELVFVIKEIKEHRF